MKKFNVIGHNFKFCVDADAFNTLVPVLKIRIIFSFSGKLFYRTSVVATIRTNGQGITAKQFFAKRYKS